MVHNSEYYFKISFIIIRTLHNVQRSIEAKVVYKYLVVTTCFM